MVTGWKKIGSKTYYFGTDGVMVTGTKTIAGKTYTFNSKGQLNGTAPSTAASGTTKISASDAGARIIWNNRSILTSAVKRTWDDGSDKDLVHDHTTVRNTTFVNNMLAYATYFVDKIDYASSVTDRKSVV